MYVDICAISYMFISSIYVTFPTQELEFFMNEDLREFVTRKVS